MPRLGSSSAQARAVVADKREAILRSAIKVFAQKGYFNSKVADVAKEAGIADGTVYLYFKSKDEILHSVFDRAMEEFISQGKQEIAEIEEADERLRRIAQLHLERLGADRDLAIVFKSSCAARPSLWKNSPAAVSPNISTSSKKQSRRAENRRFSHGFESDYGGENSLRRVG
jgi:AcrR family transcriptional regulator